jgi:twinfilin-like protein
VKDELKRQFADAITNDSVGYLKIQIVSDTFQQTGSGPNAGSRATNLAAISGVLEPRKPCYVITKTEEKDRWLMVFYVPDDSPVRDRMVYSSSLASLKLGLGAPKFGQDYTIRDKKECSIAAFDESKAKGNEEDLLTMEERMGMRSEGYVSRSTDTVKMSGMSDLPMKTSEDAVAAIKQLVAGTISTVFLSLNKDTEVMNRGEAGNIAIADIVRQLPPRDPQYVVFRYDHQHPETKEAASTIVFLYYCPDVAGPRLKMFYSSCKSMAVKTCANFGLVVAKQLEISSPSELSVASVLEELYPKKTTTKAFAKPAKPGRKGTGMIKST